MSWNLEGSYVSGVYLETNHVSGRVVESRVAYDGEVRHLVELNRPMLIYGSKRTKVVLDHKDITHVDIESDRE